MPQPVETYGLPVQPMESFFTFLTFAAWNPAVQKLYVQLTPPDDLLHSRGEARVANAIAMDHPVLGHEPPASQAIDRIHSAVPHLALADVSPKLDELRWVKTAYEVTRLRRAGDIGAAAVAEAIRGTRPGMYEYEIAAAAQYVNTRMGARGDAFPPIVPSGPLAPIVHYMDNTRQMRAGELVYMDYGSDFEYYTSDITRTWPVSGRFTAEQEKMYRCVLEARNAIIAAMKPGATIESLQEVAAPVYAKHGYAKEFEASGRYIGHFVGIAVHDVIDIVGGGGAEAVRGRHGLQRRADPRDSRPQDPHPARGHDRGDRHRRGQPDGRGAGGGRAALRVDPTEGRQLGAARRADRAARRLRKRGWSPEPYCLAAAPGTGYCGTAVLQSLDAGPVKRVARLPHPAVSRARFGPCAKLACVPNSPPSILA